LYVTESSQTYHQLYHLGTFAVIHPDTGVEQTLTTNSFGLRGPEITVPKPQGTFRILCLGDERVLAAETADNKTFSQRLQHLLQTRTRVHVEVVNAGLPGASPLISYLQLRQNLVGLQPDLILLNFDMSDIADDYHCRPFVKMGAGNIPLACVHPALTGRMVEKNKSRTPPFLLVDWGTHQFEKLIKPASKQRDADDINAAAGRYAWIRDNPPDWSMYIQQSLIPIQQIQELADGVYAKMIVATFPAPWQASASATNNKDICESCGIEAGKLYDSRVPFDMLAKFSQQHQIQYCDASPYVMQLEKPEQFYLQNAIRLSEKGHELYARVLASFIVSRIPGDWSPSRRPPVDATARKNGRSQRQ